MAYVLFDAMLDLADILTDVWHSEATSGTTTTVVDTTIYHTSGLWIDSPPGTLFLKLATKVVKKVSAHATTTITFTPAQAAAVASGDEYAVCSGMYPLYRLKRSIVMALRTLGQLPHSTTHAAVANQEEYTSTHNAVYDQHILGIEVAKNASSPFEWMPHWRWHQVPATNRTLVYDEGTAPNSTNPVRIKYLDDHTTLAAYTTGISSVIAPERLVAEARIHALRWKVQMSKQDDEIVPAMYGDAQREVAGIRPDMRQEVGEMAAAQLPEAQAIARHLAEVYPIVRQSTPRYSRW